MAVHFFSEDIPFELQNKQRRKRWLKEIANASGFQIKELNYVFCSDEYLYQLNLKYLKHDTYTDIITFDNSEKTGELEGDIFISVDRVRENAKTLHVEETTELTRVLAHGLLHLMGHKDKTKDEASLMRTKEEEAIELYRLN
jgi:probable rRNA maturation factor|uniref:rRNA maturation RNase YbeY n=1 Tax=Algoriphagus sp. TaxID=1872435 RepID=UPI004048AA43